MEKNMRELSMEEMDRVFAGAGYRERLPDKVGCIVYKVQYGDTLGKMANRHGTTKNKIKACNPQIEGDIIRTGDYIYIPE